MTINPPSFNGHHYIIVAVDYFTKWAGEIPTFENMTKNTSYFLFNHVITRLCVPIHIVTEHGLPILSPMQQSIRIHKQGFEDHVATNG